MKTKFYLILCLLLVATTTQSWCQTVVQGTAKNLESSLNVTNSQPTQLSFNMKTGPVSATNVKTEIGNYVRLTAGKFGKSSAIGSPELPVMRRLIEIPQGATVEVVVKNYQLTSFNLNNLGFSQPIVPLQPSQSKCGSPVTMKINHAVYTKDVAFKEEMVSVDVMGTLRGARIACLNIAPFSYNPVSGEIQYAYDIDFELVFHDANLSATREIKQNTYSPYFTGIYNRLLNNQYQLTDRDEITTCPVVYVVISDPMFRGQLDPFIAWKKRKGFNVIEAYTDVIGSTTTAIKTYLQDLYDNATPEVPAPSFVLFVGDVSEIPAFDNGNGATDRNYVEYTGDLFPEIYYGRFSAQNTTQLQPFIDKTLMVEQYTMPNPSYLDTVVMVAGADATYAHDWGNGQINYGTINYFNEDHGIFSNTYLYPHQSGASAQIIQNISEGVGFANYTAHCGPSGWSDPSFSQSDIPGLANQSQYGLLIGNCCSSSEYQTSCFGEDIVRASDKGAVGYIGASNSTYWDEDYYFGVGLGTISENPPPYSETGLGNYDRAFHDHGEPESDWFTTMDQHIYAGNLAVSESNSSRKQYYWDIYNLMGDPSLMIYYSVPTEMPVSHEQFIMIGTGEFSVQTAPYAYLSLNRNGVSTTTALADDNGLAVLHFTPFTTPGWAELVITAQNHKPFIENIQVFAPDGPYCIYESHEVSDDSLGNNNHHADFNENAFLSVVMNNYGTETANNVMAVITSSDADVTILDGSADYGQMPLNQGIVVDKGFLIQLSDHVADQHELIFNLTATDDQDSSWQSEFSVIAYAPVMNPGDMVVMDEVGGNGNGRLDPGETAILKFTTTNTGHAAITNVHASLEAYNAFITVLSADTILPSLNLFGACYPQFEVQVADEVPEGIFGEMHLTLEAAGYLVMRSYYPRIGMLVEDWETANFNKFDWQQDGNLPWTINHLYPYQGYYDVKSGAIADNQTSEFWIRYQVMSNDTISFFKKVSSEPDFDKLNFYIDNTLKDSWSGTTQGWTRKAYAVSTGIHTFRWSYEKDYSGTSGADCGWIDYITLPTMMATTVYAGPNNSICENNVFQCTGTATNFASLQWVTSGTGTFNSPGTLNPVYTPSNEDYLAGEVNLSLTLIDVEGLPASDTMTLAVTYHPETPVMPEGPDQIDLQVTTQSNYTALEAVSATSYIWSLTPGAGIMSGSGLTATAFWNTSYEGSAWIKVAGVNSCGMGEYSDSLEVVLANPVGFIEKTSVMDIRVVPNPNNGNFFLNISSIEPQTINITVVNAFGQHIIPTSTYSFSDRFSKNYSLIDLPDGCYFVIVQSRNARLLKKVFIK
ncbi:MAG: C25 family cysteine peptidase [Bacteroidales bacterium]|jgi:hypothetical protein